MQLRSSLSVVETILTILLIHGIQDQGSEAPSGNGFITYKSAGCYMVVIVVDQLTSIDDKRSASVTRGFSAQLLIIA